MNRYDYQFGITVNALGQRFFDEGEAKHAYTYAKTGRAVLQQPGGVAYQIYDQTGIDLFRHGRDYPATMVEAPTHRRARAQDRDRAGAVPAHGRGVQRRPAAPTSPSCRASSTARARSASARRNRIGRCRSTKGPFRAYPITGRRHLHVRRRAGRHAGARDQHHATSRSRGSMPPATSSGCSSTTTRPAPGRPATPCSAIWRAASAGARCSSKN